MVYKAHEAIAATYAKRIRQVVEEELKNPGYLEKIKTLPHSKEATNVTALLFTKVLLMGMNHALGKKKKGHKFADDVDEQAQAVQDVEVLPFEEAVEYMRARLPLDAKEYYKLADKARFRAFTVSLLADGDLLVKTKNMLAKNLEEGGGLKDFLVKTDTDLLKGVGMAGAGGGWYWETVYRASVQSSYNMGRMIQFQANPPVALEFLGIEDSRQTDICRSLSNVVRPWGDPFWDTRIPPLHFGCRSTIRGIYDEEELPTKDGQVQWTREPDIHAQEGWGFNPLKDDRWFEMFPSMERRAERYGLADMIERARERLLERDFVTGRSLSAMAKRFYVKTLLSIFTTDGDKWYIKEGSTVTGVKIIAQGQKIKDVARLVRTYPLQNGELTSINDWYKMRGTATIVNAKTGKERKAEVHWYQCKNIGKLEFKEKIWKKSEM